MTGKWYTLRPRTAEELDQLAFKAFHAWFVEGTPIKESKAVWLGLHSDVKLTWIRIAKTLMDVES
jgi:hypothetical protein